MTTAWANTLRGRPGPALAANAGGTLLAIASAVLAPWMLLSALAGKWIVRRPHEGFLLSLALLIVAVTLTQWTLRLSLGW
jgi:hypothetical protein